MEVLLFLALVLMGAFNVACFLIGAKIGQAVQKDEDIEILPYVSPFKGHVSREDKKAAQEAQERVDAIMRNIERYDGTAYGQEEIPGRK